MSSTHSKSPTGHNVPYEDPPPQVLHERERNWDSPRPVWSFSSPHRNESPMSNNSNSSPHRHTHFRARTASMSSTEDSYNPASMPSPFVRQRHHSTTSLSRPGLSPSSPAVNGKAPVYNPQASPSVRRPSSSTSLRSNSEGLSAKRLGKTPSFSGGKLRETAKPLPSNASKPSSSPASRLYRPSRAAASVASSTPASHIFAAQTDDESEMSSSESDPLKVVTGLAPPRLLDDQADPQSQELTPTLRTLPPPSSDSPDRVGNLELASSQTTERAFPRSSVPSLPEMPTFISTPPRQPSSSLKLEFTSPSPPHDLPELPDPPSSDEDDTKTRWNVRPSRSFDANKTSMLKTPKAPGAWVDTPAPARRPRSYSDTSLRRDSTTKEGSVPSSAAAGGFSMMQTPRPPGGWLATPAPTKPQYVDQSVETDTELDTEAESDANPVANGLLTPAPSERYRDIQTPAAPGAWVQTPGARKEVRFDPGANETREFANGESDASDAVGSSVNSFTQTGSPPTTPDQQTRSPRKTPGIRILDAYGNEQVEASPRRRAGVRILDQLGQYVEESTLEESSRDITLPDGGKREVLSEVSRRIKELSAEMHEVDK